MRVFADVRGTRCRSSKVPHFNASDDARLFHPATLSDALSALKTIASKEQYSLYSHPEPHSLNVVGLEYGPLSAAERRSLGASSLPDIVPSIGTRRDVFLPPLRDASLPDLPAHCAPEVMASPSSSESTLDDPDDPVDAGNCLTCSSIGTCPQAQQEVMATAAREEGRQHLRRITTLRFYEQPNPARAPRIPNLTSPTRDSRPQDDDKPFMLYRPPPPWSALPAPEARPAEARRKKARVDLSPLADARTLSADGVRERAAVKTAVTALHASVRGRQAARDAGPASGSAVLEAEAEVEAERLVSSNPFARSKKATSKKRAASITKGRETQATCTCDLLWVYSYNHPAARYNAQVLTWH